MTPLNWQEHSQKSSGRASGGVKPLVVSSSNPWFGIAMALAGLIVGMMISSLLH